MTRKYENNFVDPTEPFPEGDGKSEVLQGSIEPVLPEGRSRAVRFIASPSGRSIDDDDFEHDASLAIHGDFGSDDRRKQYADRLCALLNAAPTAGPQEETAWLIEVVTSPTLYWDGSLHADRDVRRNESFVGPNMQLDVNKAVRFPTKEAAQKALDSFYTNVWPIPVRVLGRDCYRVAEHMWVSTGGIVEPAELPHPSRKVADPKQVTHGFAMTRTGLDGCDRSAQLLKYRDGGIGLFLTSQFPGEAQPIRSMVVMGPEAFVMAQTLMASAAQLSDFPLPEEGRVSLVEPGVRKAATDPESTELDAWPCEDCAGAGWTWQPHQVAERKTDVQELKTECAACNSTGWLGPDAEKAAALPKPDGANHG